MEPHFIYCSYIYDACSIDLKRQLQVSQNKALKPVLKTHNRHPSDLLHSETNIDWLGTARAGSCCVETGPKALCDKVVQAVLNRSLRSNAEIKINTLRPRTKFGEGNMLYHGVKYWDLLNEDIQHSKSLAIFKRKLRTDNTFAIGQFTNQRNLSYI